MSKEEKPAENTRVESDPAKTETKDKSKTETKDKSTTEIRVAIITMISAVAVALISATAAIVAAFVGTGSARTAHDQAERAASVSESTAKDVAEKVVASKLEDLLTVDDQYKGVRIGDTGWFSSHHLSIAGGESDPFPVPGSFTGHLVVHGPGGNYQKVFVVGSDGYAQFTEPGGFLRPLGDFQLPLLNVERVGRNFWKIIDIPTPPPGAANQLEVALIGAVERR